MLLYSVSLGTSVALYKKILTYPHVKSICPSQLFQISVMPPGTNDLQGQCNRGRE